MGFKVNSVNTISSYTAAGRSRVSCSERYNFVVPVSNYVSCTRGFRRKISSRVKYRTMNINSRAVSRAVEATCGVVDGCYIN